MVTKEQERKALEKIAEIIRGLGNDSYIATAFDGCLEIAAQNIDDDAACSMKGQRDIWAKKARVLEIDNNNLKAKVKDRDATIEKLNSELATAKKESDGYLERYMESRNNATKVWNDFREQENKAATLEQEIVTLKAKLYDMMTAGQ